MMGTACRMGRFVYRKPTVRRASMTRCGTVCNRDFVAAVSHNFRIPFTSLPQLPDQRKRAPRTAYRAFQSGGVSGRYHIPVPH